MIDGTTVVGNLSNSSAKNAEQIVSVTFDETHRMSAQHLEWFYRSVTFGTVSTDCAERQVEARLDAGGRTHRVRSGVQVTVSSAWRRR